MEIANISLSQSGGHRFLAMTGAKYRSDTGTGDLAPDSLCSPPAVSQASGWKENVRWSFCLTMAADRRRDTRA